MNNLVGSCYQCNKLRVDIESQIRIKGYLDGSLLSLVDLFPIFEQEWVPYLTRILEVG